jgi:hypothetical protein
MKAVRQMRASDLEREQVVERLRLAFEEGRLTMDEYVGRMETACQAKTYGELATLCDDLPVAKSVPVERPVPRTAMSTFAALPGVLKVMWTIWLAIVALNVVIWAMVSVTGPQLVYPWPLWVAGPWGAILLAISAGAVANRGARSRQS